MKYIDTNINKQKNNLICWFYRGSFQRVVTGSAQHLVLRPRSGAVILGFVVTYVFPLQASTVRLAHERLVHLRLAIGTRAFILVAKVGAIDVSVASRRGRVAGPGHSAVERRRFDVSRRNGARRAIYLVLASWAVVVAVASLTYRYAFLEIRRVSNGTRESLPNSRFLYATA